MGADLPDFQNFFATMSCCPEHSFGHVGFTTEDPLKGTGLSEKRGERGSKSRKDGDASEQSQIITSREGFLPAGAEQNPRRKTKAGPKVQTDI